VDAVKSTLFDAMLDRSATESLLSKLSVGDHPVLGVSEFCDHAVHSAWPNF
jgi:hypothetical protein